MSEVWSDEVEREMEPDWIVIHDLRWEYEYTPEQKRQMQEQAKTCLTSMAEKLFARNNLFERFRQD